MFKNELRKYYLLRQKAISETQRAQWSRRIADRFFANFALHEINFLHLFLSIDKNREIETSLISNAIRIKFPDTIIIVPRIDPKKNELEHLEFDADTELRKNRWGIDEPTGKRLIDENMIDLVLVPLLCFDKRGYRVGYGRGFYDRFLAKCREDTLKIGLSFFEPLNIIKDVQNFDIKLDFCITPKKIWTF